MTKLECELREGIGVDRIMFGTDYPHVEGTWPNTASRLRHTFGGLPEAEVRGMLGENAAALYGFDLEALRPTAQRLGITPELVRQPLEEIPADSTCITFLRARAEQAMQASAP